MYVDYVLVPGLNIPALFIKCHFIHRIGRNFFFSLISMNLSYISSLFLVFRVKSPFMKLYTSRFLLVLLRVLCKVVCKLTCFRGQKVWESWRSDLQDQKLGVIWSCMQDLFLQMLFLLTQKYLFNSRNGNCFADVKIIVFTFT